MDFLWETIQYSPLALALQRGRGALWPPTEWKSYSSIMSKFSHPFENLIYKSQVGGKIFM